MSRTVIVCGGRDYRDAETVFSTLDAEHARDPITLLVHGAQFGADTLAGSWALWRHVKCRAVPADWRHLGSRAGPIRNAWMLLEFAPIAAVIAFPGGRGTADMVRRAESSGVVVITVAGPCPAP